MENKLDRQELMGSLFGEPDRIQKTDSEPAAGSSSETAVEEIDITAIRDYGGNGRKHRFRLDFGKVEEIAESIDSIGKILTPCIVRRDPDGDAEYYIVNMPEWYFLIAPEFGLLIVILCGIALIGLTVLSMYLSYKNLPLNMDEVGLQAKIMTWILRIMFAIICAYSLINAVMGFIKRETFIGLIPLTAFTALIIIVSGILSRWYNRSEKKYCGRWRLYNIIAYFSIFLLHVISVLDLTP